MDELTNSVFLQGKKISEPVLSYTVGNENFYEMKIQIKRQSTAEDILTVSLSERVKEKIEGQEFVTITGELRTRNYRDENEKNHMKVYIFAKDGYLNLEEKYENEVTICGFVCKKPIFRTTPKNRDICDLLIAVNRPSGKRSDYIPSIVWGRLASYAGELAVGDNILVEGRFQSRIYEKKFVEETKQMTAYELSISSLSKLSNKESE